MPIYEASCPECGAYHTYYQAVNNCYETPFCDCGAKTEKGVFTAPMGIVDIPAYQSPVTGRWINSRSQRAEDLKRNGCRPWEGMEQEKKEADRQKAYAEADEDKKLTRSAEIALAQMAPEKRRILETSL